MIRRLLLLFALPALLVAAPDDEWAAITAMDSGPKKVPSTREEAKSLARLHLASQKHLIEEFLAKYPGDPRADDARFRLAALLATIGNMDGTQQPVDEAMRILTALEKSRDLPLEKRANAGFRLASLYLQSMRGREAEMRGSIVDCARNFVVKFPGDRRGPRLLVEVASICDNDPALKRSLLEQASSLTSEEPLRSRISDDLLRLGLLNRTLDLNFTTVQRGTFRADAQRGKVVVILFWSAESPHCLLWLPSFRRTLDRLPKDRFSFASIALDTNRKAFERRLKEFRLDAWPAAFDGKGWASPLARPLGINSLPTVFVLDKAGTLRALNAQNSCEPWVRQLLLE